MQKQIKLKELVDDIKEEEEPAGEDVPGPSGEVIEAVQVMLCFFLCFFFKSFHQLYFTTFLLSHLS